MNFVCIINQSNNTVILCADFQKKINHEFNAREWLRKKTSPYVRPWIPLTSLYKDKFEMNILGSQELPTWSKQREKPLNEANNFS